jgi:hypothetical protein
MSHSCDGNAIRVSYGDVMMVRALRDIAKKEKL